ncbi:MAG: T9SS C-terminal target domain-containing protein [Chitinophagaceae bacterium]|nr:MAG: T9SS C-terminal target domain-containing protein [Chitinophagaceae bacterium]
MVFRVFISLLFCCNIVFTQNIQAQCTPDMTQVNPGLEPDQNLTPCFVRNSTLSVTLNFKNLDEFSPPGFPSGFPIRSTTIDSIVNLPCGLEWSTNYSDNTFSAGEAGCIQIFGITDDLAGQYNIDIWASIDIDMQGSPFPFPPIDVNLSDWGYDYHIRVREQASPCPDVGSSDSPERTACFALEAPEFTPSAVCNEGDTILITFNSSETFDSTNVFAVELSDENGDFSSPVIIGTLESTTAAPIECIIPPSLTAGNDYRIRIHASSPEIISFVSNNSFEILPIPAEPEITANENVLASSYSTGNQWFLNGELIEGAEGQFYTAEESGFYTVIYTSPEGCSSELSEVYNLTISGLGELQSANSRLLVYPNPATMMLYWKLPDNLSNIKSATVYHVDGRRVFDLKNLEKGYINLEKVSPGIYFLKIKGEKFKLTERFVVF